MVEGKQLVAIRVTRPYADEDEFLEHEIETLTRTSVMLVGAQSRPQGVILRFEVALLNGTPLMRGEGRVIGFKPNAVGDLPGLTLRFTRLDKKTKALVDRAAAIREARARAAFEASMDDSEMPPPQSQPPISLSPASMRFPEPPPSAPESVPSLESIGSSPSLPSLELDKTAAMPAFTTPPSSKPVPIPVTGPVMGRDSILDRLRERARSLAPATVSALLEEAKRLRKRTSGPPR